MFGSKDGLLVQALARRAFEFLYAEIAKLEETDDPAADLVDVGVLVVRRLVREHPALYRIAFQRVVPGMDAGPELMAARQRAWSQLVGKVERLEAAGLLGGKPPAEAAVEFNAMMEGLGERRATRCGAPVAAGGKRGGSLAECPRRHWCGGSRLARAAKVHEKGPPAGGPSAIGRMGRWARVVSGEPALPSYPVRGNLQKTKVPA